MISTVLPAYKYLLEERKLNEDTIRSFHLGYCAQDGEVYIDADFQGQLPPLDKRFYHSTMFPIQSVYGDTIAVSCRPLIAKPDSPKYINSSYEKADHLYALAQTWHKCLKEKAVYVVEGNISLLQMWQAGIKNCVAMLGSNLSTTQVCLLNRFVTKIVMVPDSDKAGMNVIEKLRKNIPQKMYDSDIQFFYVQLPQGTDPDDYFKAHTKQEFLALPEQELI